MGIKVDENYYKDFVVTDKMRDELMKVGERNRVKPDYPELKSKKSIFQVHLKAQIAKGVWGNDGFYPIFNQTNEVLQQAIKLFDEAPEIDKLKM